MLYLPKVKNCSLSSSRDMSSGCALATTTPWRTLWAESRSNRWQAEGSGGAKHSLGRPLPTQDSKRPGSLHAGQSPGTSGTGDQSWRLRPPPKDGSCRFWPSWRGEETTLELPPSLTVRDGVKDTNSFNPVPAGHVSWRGKAEETDDRRAVACVFMFFMCDLMSFWGLI